jgi:hypothetical protein
MKLKHPEATVSRDNSSVTIPMRIGSRDIIPPEVELAHIRLQDGDYKLGFIDGMRVLILASRYNQLLAASQAEVVKNQLEIMKQAKSESEEVALKAATFVLEQMKDEIMKQKADIATVPKPFEGLISRMMETALSGLMKQFLPKEAQAEIGLPGVTVEKRKREG